MHDLDEGLVDDSESGDDKKGFPREEFLRRAAAAGVVALGAGAVGVGEGGAAIGRLAAGAAKPRRGGKLIIGIGGGGAKDSLDAHQATNEADYARVPQLYEGLVARDSHFNLVNTLAESFEPSHAAKVWTIRLRDGVEFHNGKTMTVDDLIYSIHRVFHLSYAPPRQYLNGVDPKNGLKKLDKRTLRLTLRTPNGILRDSADRFYVVPVGYNPKRPVGTGPWKFTSFTPGKQSVFAANRNWWGGWEKQRGGPYADQLQLVDISDDSARVNALLSGQVHASSAIPLGQIPVVKNHPGLKLFVERSGDWRPFTMRVDVPPFNDVRVRQAMRLIVDRPQMLQQALAGNGRIANDLYSPQDPYSIHPPQRHQDIAQAKSLLKQAGQENLTVELTTAAIQAGVLEMSQVLVTQAQQAGVTIKLTQIDPGVFYGSQYLQYPFSVDFWNTDDYLVATSASCGPTAQFNETHWADRQFESLYKQAITTQDAGKRKHIVQEMQQIQFDRGGYIIPFFPNTVDAYSTKIAGFVPYAGGRDFGDFHFHTVHFV